MSEGISQIQDILLTSPTVKNFDGNKDVYLVTDASMIAICAILMQKHNNQFYLIEFYSKQLNQAESTYPSIKREF